MPTNFTVTGRVEIEDATGNALDKIGGKIDDFAASATKAGDAVADTRPSFESFVETMVSASDAVGGDLPTRLSVTAGAVQEAAAAFAEGKISLQEFTEVTEAVKVANDKIRESFEQLNPEKVRGGFEKFTDFLKDRFVITLGDVRRVVGEVTGFFTSMISEASESQAVTVRLTNAYGDMTPAGQAVVQMLSDQADALQRTTKYSDEAIKAGQALLATFIKDADQLRGATQAAVDLAAALGIELTSAFRILQRAHEGSTAGLARYGIVIDESVPKSEKFAAVLAKINDKMSGRAVADAQTYAGLMAQIGNAYNELKEKAGLAVIENDKAVDSLKRLRDVLQDPGTTRGVSAVAAVVATGAGNALAEMTRVVAEQGTIIEAWKGNVLAGLQVALSWLAITREKSGADEAGANALRALVAEIQAGTTAAEAAAKANEAEAASQKKVNEAVAQSPLERYLLQMEAARLSQERFNQTSAAFGSGLQIAEAPLLNIDGALKDLKDQFDTGKISLDQYLTEYDALIAAYQSGAGQTATVTKNTKEEAEAHRESAAAVRESAKAHQDATAPTKGHGDAVKAVKESVDALPGSLHAYNVALNENANATGIVKAALVEWQGASQRSVEQGQAMQVELDALNAYAANHVVAVDSMGEAYRRLQKELQVTVTNLATTGNAAQSAAQQVSGAFESMRASMDQPGDPLPSGLGLGGNPRGQPSRSNIGDPISGYYQKYDSRYGGNVTAFRITSPTGAYSGAWTEFYTLPDGTVIPSGAEGVTNYTSAGLGNNGGGYRYAGGIQYGFG